MFCIVNWSIVGSAARIWCTSGERMIATNLGTSNVRCPIMNVKSFGKASLARRVRLREGASRPFMIRYSQKVNNGHIETFWFRDNFDAKSIFDDVQISYSRNSTQIFDEIHQYGSDCDLNVEQWEILSRGMKSAVDSQWWTQQNRNIWLRSEWMVELKNTSERRTFFSRSQWWIITDITLVVSCSPSMSHIDSFTELKWTLSDVGQII
jgi:hypothetical protein